MLGLFIDESGDHNLTLIDENYPVFVLAGGVFNLEYHKGVVTNKLSKLKEQLFEKEKVILHYKDYTRNTNGFEKVKDKEFREKFYGKLNDLLGTSKFTVLACIIDKKKHVRQYGLVAMDPYLLSLNCLVERFVYMLRSENEKGVIIAESRGAQLDNQLELAWLDLKIKGTKFVRPIEIKERINDLVIRKKKDNIAGLQLIDTVATPIGRKYLGLKNHYLKYDQIKEKIRKSSCGKYKGFGLIILPK